MKIQIKAKANSKKPGIEKISETEWIVRVKEPARDGKANQAIIRMIAESLSIPISRVEMLRGESSKIKLIEIS
ncbi:MAG: DUF167 domain-containing protein [Leptospiraceae bacterium]|nr:DUF167 domain-containing protein [Leptospiraceae bacterium]MCP5512356.1 DUF167 domain-containing protein [Leptospiraceae bacterium]